MTEPAQVDKLFDVWIEYDDFVSKKSSYFFETFTADSMQDMLRVFKEKSEKSLCRWIVKEHVVNKLPEQCPTMPTEREMLRRGMR